MRRAAKVDSNHSSIVDALRGIGASVYSVASLKRGFDVLVGYRGRDTKLEIKDGSLPPSKRRLTQGEADFHATWRGSPVIVVESIEQALAVILEG